MTEKQKNRLLVGEVSDLSFGPEFYSEITRRPKSRKRNAPEKKPQKTSDFD